MMNVTCQKIFDMVYDPVKMCSQPAANYKLRVIMYSVFAAYVLYSRLEFTYPD